MPGSQIYPRGVDVTLTCSVLGGPLISYRWLFNGRDTDGENSSTLTLTSVDASDGGEYTCVVSNTAGNDSASSTVYIFPYFTIAPEDVESSNGDNVTLSCEAEAFPDPSYAWTKIDEIIRESATVIDSTSLSFEPVLFGDEGSYNCSVTSESGIIWSDAVLSGKLCFLFFLSLFCILLILTKFIMYLLLHIYCNVSQFLLKAV